MKLFDFKLLSQREQVEVLYNQGVYIGKKKQGETIILLYQLESFYVEIYYRKYRCYVLGVHCFTSTSRLDPYLGQIDVESLVNF